MVGGSNYDSNFNFNNNMNNVIIPTGSDNQLQDVNVATFRDENTSLNGQLNILESSDGRSRTMQSDALGYGTF